MSVFTFLVSYPGFMELDELTENEGVVLWGMIVNAHRALNEQIHDQIAKAAGVTGTEFEFLLRLARFPRRTATATQVAARMGLTSGGTTKLVSRLLSQSLLARTRDPADARAYRLTLTPAGEQALELGLEAHIPTLTDHLLAAYTPNQRRELARLLIRLAPENQAF